MSESTLPPAFGDGAVEPAALERRTKALAAGALALAVLGGGGVLLLGGGGSDDLALEQAAPTAQAPGSAATPTPAATPTRPARTDAGPARDPFAVLYQPPAAAVPPTVPDPGAMPAAAVPSGSDRPAEQVGGATPDTRGAPSEQTPRAAVPGLALRLDAVVGPADARTASFTLGSEKLTAEVGESFGAAAQLLLLSLQEGPGDGQWTAVVQVGDGDPFDVVSGAPARPV